MYPCQEGLLGVKLPSGWNYINKKGKFISKDNLEEVSYAFENGFGGIKLNNKWGIIDKQGKIVVTPKFDMNIVNPDFVK
ncbi:WG repeat-containing protein, partial [Clostridium haemolyticum]